MLTMPKVSNTAEVETSESTFASPFDFLSWLFELTFCVSSCWASRSRPCGSVGAAQGGADLSGQSQQADPSGAHSCAYFESGGAHKCACAHGPPSRAGGCGGSVKRGAEESSFQPWCLSVWVDMKRTSGLLNPKSTLGSLGLQKVRIRRERERERERAYKSNECTRNTCTEIGAIWDMAHITSARSGKWWVVPQGHKGFGFLMWSFRWSPKNEKSLLMGLSFVSKHQRQPCCALCINSNHGRSWLFKGWIHNRGAIL